MNKNPIDSSTVKSHPSYGAITLGRMSSGAPHPMYGSSVKHRDTIRLTLHHGECKRMLSGDWYSSGRSWYLLLGLTLVSLVPLNG